jgi:hypothetical protein
MAVASFGPLWELPAHSWLTNLSNLVVVGRSTMLLQGVTLLDATMTTSACEYFLCVGVQMALQCASLVFERMRRKQK